MSCDNSHSSCLEAFALSIICVKVDIGIAVEVFGRATWLLLLSIGYLVRILLSLLVIIFVRIFRVCSIRVIGRVLFSCPVNLGFLKMG